MNAVLAKPLQACLTARPSGPLRGTVEDEVYLGDRTEWIVRVSDEALTVAQPAHGGGGAVRRGDVVGIAAAPEAVLRLEDEQAGA